MHPRLTLKSGLFYLILLGPGLQDLVAGVSQCLLCLLQFHMVLAECGLTQASLQVSASAAAEHVLAETPRALCPFLLSISVCVSGASQQKYQHMLTKIYF